MAMTNFIKTSLGIFRTGLVLAAHGPTRNLAAGASEVDDPESDEPVALVSDGLFRCDDVSRLGSSLTGTLDPTATVDDRLMGVLSSYAQEHRDTYAGHWIDRENGGVLVIAFTDDPEPHKAALLERLETGAVGIEPPPPITNPGPLGERDDFVFDVVQARYTEAELLGAQQVLHRKVDMPALAVSEVDPMRNIVSVELVDPSVTDLEAITHAVSGLPICVNILVPSTRRTSQAELLHMTSLQQT